VPENETPTYVKIQDEGIRDTGHHGLAHWQRVGLVLLAASIFAALMFVNPANSIAKDTFSGTHAGEMLSLPEQMTFGASPHFLGSTAEYFIEPGGSLSASLESGFNGTVTLLDHRLQYIVDGEISITDGTGQGFVGKAGDLFYLPPGSQVTYDTPKSATTYVVIADKALQPVEHQKQVHESARKTKISYFPDVKDRKSKRFQEYSDKLTPGTSSAFFDEVGCFKWTGKQLPSGKFPSWNMCCGIFYLKAGPSFTSGKYVHHYEIDLMLDGELHYHGLNGHDLAVKEGDLVRNPRQSDVHIEAPDFGKFITISLSDVDDFWR